MGGCQWLTTQTRADGSQGDVMVVVVPARYHERPTLAKSFRDVTDVGAKGFVAQDMGGWVAGAIALLKESIRRHAS